MSVIIPEYMAQSLGQTLPESHCTFEPAQIEKFSNLRTFQNLGKNASVDRVKKGKGHIHRNAFASLNSQA